MKVYENTEKHTHIHAQNTEHVMVLYEAFCPSKQARTNAENLPKASVIPTNVESKELYRKQVGYARLPPSGPKQIQAKKYLLG